MPMIHCLCCDRPVYACANVKRERRTQRTIFGPSGDRQPLGDAQPPRPRRPSPSPVGGGRRKGILNDTD